MSTFQISELAYKNFLVTGGAGFIGSNIAEFLVRNGAKHVRVLDNLATGYRENIQELEGKVNFEFINGDIRNYDDCARACQGIDIVLHQAALGSVPRSIKDPATTNAVNIDGFLNMLLAAKENSVKRFVYASSSSVYGNDATMPKIEDKTGELLSPYAVSKYTNELYAKVFSKTYQIETVGLRYFNVFGPKQSPQGPYAAVIPLFIQAILKGEAPTIFGDGENTRDFTYVENVVNANLAAAFSSYEKSDVYNIAYGATTSLNKLFAIISKALKTEIKPVYGPVRTGDIKDSFADINKAKNTLGYTPSIDLEEGLTKTVEWFMKNRSSKN